MMNWINKKRNRKGFTLVELVVVIAILGILAAIAIPKLGKSRETANYAKHDANARILKSAAMMYLADNPENYLIDTDLLSGTEGAVGVLMQYLDGTEPPKTYDGGNFTVKITSGGDIEVSPDEGAYKTSPTP